MQKPPREAESDVIARLQRLARGSIDPTHTLDQARDALFRDYQDALIKVCLRIVGNRERAEELANDAALTAWEKLVTGEFEGRSQLSTFMYGIARNKAYQSVRKRSEDLMEEDQLFAQEAAGRSAFQALTRNERIECLQSAVADLDPLDQEVVQLRYVEGLPYEAIERILEIDRARFKSGVRGILVRSKRHLEKSLRAWLVDHDVGSSFFDETS